MHCEFACNIKSIHSSFNPFSSNPLTTHNLDEQIRRSHLWNVLTPNADEPRLGIEAFN